MSDFFSSLSCCWFWLVAGILIGWLLNRYLCRCCCKPSQITADNLPPPPHQPNRQTNALTADTTSNSASVEASKAIPSDKKPSKSAPAKSTVKSPAPAKAKIVTPKVNFDLAAAKAAGFSIKQANDLTVVEGIGPKINELFKENGIQTFAQLAQQTVPQMRAILDKGGARYRIANPATWAQQADLAANNQWAELKKLQESLSGGVKK
jgi:predicted flap endonuclease-1-like 5' DNA nuclease